MAKQAAALRDWRMWPVELVELSSSQALANGILVQQIMGEAERRRASRVELRELLFRQSHIHGSKVVLQLRQGLRSDNRNRTARGDPGDGHSSRI